MSYLNFQLTKNKAFLWPVTDLEGIVQFFHFHAVFGKKACKNNRLVLLSKNDPLLWKILVSPLVT